MAFFDDISKKVSDVARTVGNKGREVADIAKLKYRISEEERKADEIYKRIGKLFVEKAGDRAKGVFAELIGEINSSKARVEGYKAQIRELKGDIVCDGCGAEITSDATFCPVCGKKADRPDRIPPICPNCGVTVDEGATFCVDCGTQLK